MPAETDHLLGGERGVGSPDSKHSNLGRTGRNHDGYNSSDWSETDDSDDGESVARFILGGTKPQPKQEENTGFPLGPMVVLALVRLAEPVALTSIFPYCWPMVKKMLGQDSSDFAAFRSGLLIASFSLAEALSGMYWGGVSDRIGRKPILLLGCAGTLISMLLVGVAPNYWVALLGRLMGGLLNGNGGVVQSMVSELVVHKEHAAQAFAMIPFIWTMGAIIGPSIGGYFAEPAGRLIDVNTTNPLLQMFIRHEYLLPNVVAGAMLAISIVAGAFFLPETNPARKRKQQRALENAVATTTYGTGRFQGEFDAEVEVESQSIIAPSVASSRPSIPRHVKVVIFSLGLFVVHSMCFDHLLPMFLQDAIAPVYSFAGGLGLSIDKVGILIGSIGFLDLFLQLVVFPRVIATFGKWNTFRAMTWLHPVPMFLLPFLVLLIPDSMRPSAPPTLNASLTASSMPFPYSIAASAAAGSDIPRESHPFSWSVVFGLAVIIVLKALSCIIGYPVLLLMLDDAVKGKVGPAIDDDYVQLFVDPNDDLLTRQQDDPDFDEESLKEVEAHLGAINGLSASVQAGCRMIASPVGGFLFSIGTQIGVCAVPWWAATLVAIIGIWHIRNY